MSPEDHCPHVHYLRTLADSRAIIAAAGSARRVVVIGAGFIGLEVAASLRERGLEVHVVTPDARPLERILGPEAGDFVRELHEKHGVVFHFGQTASAIPDREVELANGGSLPADLVVVGIGVRPSTSLAEKAGLQVDRGILVNDYFETSAKGIFAAGDVARYPDFRTGQLVRIEHFVAAERQGQAAARNMLGRPRAIPSRPVLLEPALRRGAELRRPRRAVGRDGPGRNLRVGQLSSGLQERRKDPGRPHIVARPREPRGGSGDGRRGRSGFLSEA